MTTQVVFRNMDPSSAVEEKVHAKVEKLKHYFNHILNCRVVVEASHRHHYKGNLYHVRIDLTLPNAELVASRDADKDHSHEDVYVAIRDSFNSIKRQLEEFVDKQRGMVKHHNELVAEERKNYSDRENPEEFL